MGLAPYGEPTYVDAILEHLVDLKEDGTFRLNMRYFSYLTGLTMVGREFERRFGGPPRRPDQPITGREMNLARSIQAVTEEIMLRLARTVHREQGGEHLCLAGGVALNCVANGRILREGPYEDIWIQPAAGDAGGALGAALSVWHEFLGYPREPAAGDSMAGALLGPAWSDADIHAFLDSAGAVYTRLEDDQLMARVAELVDEGRVVGWFQGRMEFGPRALGNRSILADARDPDMQSVLNLKIKFRESFRPFAPAVRAEDAREYFDLDRPSPYMLLVAAVEQGPARASVEQGFSPAFRTSVEQGFSPAQESRASALHTDSRWSRASALLGTPGPVQQRRSAIPAVTHVDGSARVQTVDPETQSALPRPPERVSRADRLRRARQHLVQRPRRAHRLRAARRLPVLSRDGHGPPRTRQLLACQGRPGGAGLPPCSGTGRAGLQPC